MKITFFSNFLNHHQLPFCEEMIKILGNDFKFVATQKIPSERINLGYEDMNSKYDFVVRAYEDERLPYKLALESDIVIIGSAPDKYIRKRLKQNKIVFRYSERVFKKGFAVKTFFSLLVKRALLERKNTYLLCASAYAANDFNMAKAYINKTYKWGYFPETIKYPNINNIIKSKEKNSILWVARFLDWKHPEIVLKIAKKLRKENYNFKINMIGTGELFDYIDNQIKENKLENNIELLGSMPPEKVREYMEKSEVFLFTSDRGEGWGAVLNEAMNSACTVIASHEIGSVPFLIKKGENGFIYENGNINELYHTLKLVLDNKELPQRIGLNAYNSIINLWNPQEAAKRLIELSESIINNKSFNKYKDGPCSIALRVKDNWYGSETND